MKQTDLFLTLYKEYESVLREQNLDYKVIEESAEDMVQNRMRICRQFRNYLSHNHDEGFLQISDVQIKFLQQLLDKQRMTADVLKKHVKTVRTASCSPAQKCTEVLPRMIKLKVDYFPVYEEGTGVLGMVSIWDVTAAMLISKTAKIGSIKKYTKVPLCAKPDEQMERLYMYAVPLICCTDTGTADGKLLGVYFVN